jgi:hypothetical protein
MTQFISATEKIFRELSQPKPPQPARPPAEVKKIELTKADVTGIIQRKRSSTPEELEYVLAHSQEHGVTSWQASEIRLDLTIAMAQRSRGANGRKEDPNLKFISQTLGLVPTPHGLIDRSFIENVLRAAAQNIQRCRRHLPPSCACWSSQRAILRESRRKGDKTPEGWAALRMFEILEDLELASRPEAC